MKASTSKTKVNLGLSLLSVSSLTFLSRILGLIRDMVIAAVFPIGLASDAFFTAFKIPNTLRRLTAEGAFSQAFVPVYNSERNQNGEEAAAKLRDQVASWLAIILALIAIVGVLGAPLLIEVIAPGFKEIEGKQQVASELLRITFPYIVLISLTAFGGAILNSFGRFAAFAFIPALLNLSLIAAALVLAPRFEHPIDALAWGVLIGGVIQLAWQATAMWKYGQLPRFRFPKVSNAVKRIFKLTGQGALGVSIAQVSIIVSLVFASFLEEGSVSWLYFADRIMELPVGLLGAALGVIILPTLSRQAATNDTKAYSATLEWSLKIALLFGIPSAIGLALLALPVAATIFQHGSYTPHDSMQTALAITAYSLGIPALVCVKVLAAGFYSYQNPMTPVKVSMLSLTVIIILNFVLTPFMYHAGLALSLAIGALINASLLFVLLIKYRLYLPNTSWLRFATKILIAGILMSILLWWMRGEVDQWTSASAIERIINLLGCVITGALLYFLSLFVLGMRIRDFRPPSTNV